MKTNQRLARVRALNGLDNAYYYNDADRAQLSKVTFQEREDELQKRMLEIEEELEKYEAIAEQNQKKAGPPLVPGKAKKKFLTGKKNKDSVKDSESSHSFKKVGDKRMKHTLEKEADEVSVLSANKRNQKAAAKKLMKDLHKKQGHELKDLQDLKRKNKSLTLQALHEFCSRYMTHSYQVTLESVHDKRMYISCTNVLKRAKQDFEYYPADDKEIQISNQSLYELYFRSKEGKKREWKIIQTFPKWSEMNDTIFIECWFLEGQNRIISVDFIDFMKHCKCRFEQVTFAAYLALNINDVEYFAKN